MIDAVSTPKNKKIAFIMIIIMSSCNKHESYFKGAYVSNKDQADSLFLLDSNKLYQTFSSYVPNIGFKSWGSWYYSRSKNKVELHHIVFRNKVGIYNSVITSWETDYFGNKNNLKIVISDLDDSYYEKIALDHK